MLRGTILWLVAVAILGLGFGWFVTFWAAGTSARVPDDPGLPTSGTLVLPKGYHLQPCARLRNAGSPD